MRHGKILSLNKLPLTLQNRRCRRLDEFPVFCAEMGIPAVKSQSRHTRA
ncbi:hypothetical protein HMPREF9370_0634 [Neisseria wadsworthii 9715]|uniref:Uncharacterized protein n=1 Tax=Neisseria wadsworthii 9715 TaxID=1030841 RepID=G4CNH5_9NEIS|nr:hypothetical protein HMPREF9370_0634 [Neisseria wadsworthii 9715]